MHAKPDDTNQWFSVLPHFFLRSCFLDTLHFLSVFDAMIKKTLAAVNVKQSAQSKDESKQSVKQSKTSSVKKASKQALKVKPSKQELQNSTKFYSKVSAVISRTKRSWARKNSYITTLPINNFYLLVCWVCYIIYITLSFSPWRLYLDLFHGLTTWQSPSRILC